MNLAAPAPKVEPATVARQSYAEPAVADRVQQSEPVRVDTPRIVEPATTYDDPRKFAPTLAGPTKPGALSVESLRASSGSIFESYAAVLRGAPIKNFLRRWFPILFDERDFITFGEAKKYVVVKGPSCFIYNDEHDPSPLYAIDLTEVYPIREDPNRPDAQSFTVSPTTANKPPKHMVTILLKFKKDKSQAYQFTFDLSATNRDLPGDFFHAVEASDKFIDSVGTTVLAEGDGKGGKGKK